ncbi:FeoA family protein [Deinococcus cellulosilyticus]|uniref:Ferrous iron transporter FeoA-like domain-containing protein n=1 Tax=Deinococcus cellulosilyticus (strain DSM 18568 / NBRC 106333 / KACC 11606 / 5516J-15) TaxID=1223518 RepID=A0A511NAF8_DEIC1|nr:FeoA family protein [Deinococcus cellulosilyticus]GEM49814.1 hypothetical protein DC3_54490 [Deinococcus cellulosilyticus NBRC 106333 = KACC 11606]
MRTELSTIDLGQTVTLHGIHPAHPMRKRLFELGFIPGASIQVIRKAPLGDPVELVVGGTHFALRLQDMKQIWVHG